MSSAADPSQDPPMATPIALLLPPITALPASSTRRLPPPCWTPDETSALIDAYRDKWYALRRANLRAPHWDDVAADVHRRCPHASPPKTALQCRHKMEKLRKRYRDELRRADSIPHHRFSSSWTFFSLMDAMEKGPTTSPPVVATVVSAAGDDDDLNDTEDDYEPIRDFNRSHVRGTSNSELGFQSKKMRGDFDGIPNPNPKYNGMDGYDSRSPSSRFDERVRYAVKKSSNGSSGEMNRKMDVNWRKEMKRRREAMEMEMVEAVRMVGEGLVRTEKMKMEMMRESERIRMDMEMKRTQMILDSQHRILQAFCSNAININQ